MKDSFPLREKSKASDFFIIFESWILEIRPFYFGKESTLELRKQWPMLNGEQDSPGQGVCVVGGTHRHGSLALGGIQACHRHLSGAARSREERSAQWNQIMGAELPQRSPLLRMTTYLRRGFNSLKFSTGAFICSPFSKIKKAVLQKRGQHNHGSYALSFPVEGILKGSNGTLFP